MVAKQKNTINKQKKIQINKNKTTCIFNVGKYKGFLVLLKLVVFKHLTFRSPCDNQTECVSSHFSYKFVSANTMDKTISFWGPERYRV